MAETTIDGSAMSRTSYVLSDDVISQTESDWTWHSVTESWDLSAVDDTRYLLYDGHGSTRQLAHWTGSDISVDESYNYDGYGVMLSDGSGAAAASNAATSLLYAGEQYDPDVSGYYLRARYYNPANGLFNRVDPYAGNMQDPQSLHKYAYCHNNPVNGIDPTGMWNMPEINMKLAVSAVIANISLTVAHGVIKGHAAGVIAGNVVRNLAFFALILVAAESSGIVVPALCLTVLLKLSIDGLFELLEAWPEMDAVDRIFAISLIMTYIAFGSSISARPTPNRSSSGPDIIVRGNSQPVITELEAFPDSASGGYWSVRGSNGKVTVDATCQVQIEGSTVRVQNLSVYEHGWEYGMPKANAPGLIKAMKTWICQRLARQGFKEAVFEYQRDPFGSTGQQINPGEVPTQVKTVPLDTYQ